MNVVANAYKSLLLTLVLALGTAWGPRSAAQDKPAADKPAAPSAAKGGGGGGDKRKTSIDFEDELIEGELKKPELFYLLQKKQFNFKRLIKLREDFLPEMRRSTEDVRRSGSGD
jgi:hypothetical protein